METSLELKPEAPRASFTYYDAAFLVFLVLVFCVVTWLGIFARQEALKTEAAKSNGEAWVTWLKYASQERFQANYAYPACAGGDIGKAMNAAPATPPLPESNAEQAAAPAAAASAAAPVAAASAANTWEGCLKQLLQSTSFKDMRNPFTAKAASYVDNCVPSDTSLAGGIDIEKSVATPPGSAVAFVKSNLMPADSIREKLLLTVTVCDKGGYPIKISDVEF
jgi:Na+-transporting methylmalonyl-CoA/oxaloacetate decarboxylase gamma subunit